MHRFPFTAVLRSATHPRRSYTTIISQVDRLKVPALSASFPYVWLRDSCQCPRCVDPSTRQKLHKSSDFPTTIAPLQIDGSPSVRATSSPDGLRIHWEDQHKSFYSADFLQRHSSPSQLARFHQDGKPEPWNKSQITALWESGLVTSYDALASPSKLLQTINSILRYGLVLVRGVPFAQTSDEKCELRKLASMFGRIRHTFYGWTWDVRNIRNSKNIAYTNLDLGWHMDLLYLQNPPRYQVLHCLRNRVKGGQSLFVDGINAANELFGNSREDFECLVNTPVNFHYINDNHHLHCSHPTLVVDRTRPRAEEPPTIKSIYYSPPFQAPLPLDTPIQLYDALGEFAKRLDAEENRFKFLLREGDAVIFDNRRVLHARSAFEDIALNEEAGGGDGKTNRWLKGCYLDEDPLFDEYRRLLRRAE